MGLLRWSLDATGVPAPAGLGQSSRGSTNTALLRTARLVAPGDVVATRYESLHLLPHFNPDDDTAPLPAPVVDLRARIAGSDAVLFSTPEYAGALPGSFKNLLDWTVGGIELYRKPVAWVNASASPTNAADAHESLRKVLGFVGSDLVEAACVHIPVPRSTIGPDGLVEDRPIRTQVAAVLRTVADHVAQRGDDAGPAT